MIVLGLTGSIGMGKSTAAEMLRDLGVPVHDSDVAVHQALGANGAGVQAVANLFPASYDVSTKAIDRKALGAIVFQKPDLKKQLEDILHPLVRDEQQKFLLEHRNNHVRLVALDIPLLYETGGETRVDKVIVVTCPYFIQRRRVLSRPGMTAEKFQNILASQMPDAEKKRRADFVVQTGLGRAHTYGRLKKIIHTLMTGPNHDPHRNDFPSHHR